MLRPGETTRVDALLKPLVHRGSLWIESTEPATVFIDGAPFGAAPWQGALVPGRHVYFVRGKTHGSAPTAVRVIEGQVVKVMARATPLGPEFRVRVDPPTAELSIDGVRLSPGSWRGRLPRGVHRFEAGELGYRTASASVDPALDRDIVLTLVVDRAHPRWKGCTATSSCGSKGWLGFAIGPGIGSGAERVLRHLRLPGERSGARHVRRRTGSATWFRGESRSKRRSATWLSGPTSAARSAMAFCRRRAPGSVGTQYLIKDELTLLGPFASLGGSYSWPLARNLALALGAHAGGWIVSSSDRAQGSVSGAGAARRVTVDGSGATTRSTDLFVHAGRPSGHEDPGHRHRRRILGAGFLVGRAGRVARRRRDVRPEGTCRTSACSTVLPARSSQRSRKPTHGPFVAFGPYASVAHRF